MHTEVTALYKNYSHPIFIWYTNTCIRLEFRILCKKIKKELILNSVIKYNLCLIFLDIDECIISKPCDTNATCENFVGSYNCTCKKGFTGNGTTCTGNLITDNEKIW